MFHTSEHTDIPKKCQVLNRRSNLRGCPNKASTRREQMGSSVSPAPVSWLYQSQFSLVWNTRATTWVQYHAQYQSLHSSWLGLTVCRAGTVESEIEDKPDTHPCLRLQNVPAILCSCAYLSQKQNKNVLSSIENNTYSPSSLRLFQVNYTIGLYTFILIIKHKIRSQCEWSSLNDI